MTEFKDHFSRQAGGYTRYRPHYPNELFTFLASLCERAGTAWDCGCGNGQAAHGLRRHFKQVFATDASAAQIEKAVPADGISYRVAPAEKSGLPARSIDLVVVAQALHWFDFDPFYDEVRRVGRPGTILAAVGYGLMRIKPEVDVVIDHLYSDLLADVWPPERRHIDAAYRTIPFPFPEFETPKMAIEAEWSLDHCRGYLETWSAVQQFRREKGECPLTLIDDDLETAWGDREKRYSIRWPLFFRIGRIDGTVDPAGSTG